MKVELTKISGGRYALTLGERRIEIDVADLDAVRRLIDDALRPESRIERAVRYRTFLEGLRAANDTGIQALLRSAAHDGILVLLYSSEHDAALKKKLYGNMTENSIKMYVEDLLFEFRNGVPDYRFDGAMLRLIEHVDDMVRAGTLTMDQPAR
jgi:flagellar motor switch protein FliG